MAWTEPFDGGSAITGYGVRYKRSSDSVWTSWPHTGTGRMATITGLEQGGLSYDVQVQATNIQGSSLWSVNRTGLTPNQAPYAPAAPTLIGAAGSLAVSWAAPYNGGSAITDYDVRYKKSTATTWTSWPHTRGRVRTATITGINSLSIMGRAGAGDERAGDERVVSQRDGDAYGGDRRSTLWRSNGFSSFRLAGL